VIIIPKAVVLSKKCGFRSQNPFEQIMGKQDFDAKISAQLTLADSVAQMATQTVNMKLHYDERTEKESSSLTQ